MTILSHDGVRDLVARWLIANPERGMDAAIEAAATSLHVPTDDVRAIVDRVDEELAS